MHLFATDVDRLQWHTEIDAEYSKVKDDPFYVPPTEVISKASRYGPTEIVLHTPYRAGKDNFIYIYL